MNEQLKVKQELSLESWGKYSHLKAKKQVKNTNVPVIVAKYSSTVILCPFFRFEGPLCQYMYVIFAPTG